MEDLEDGKLPSDSIMENHERILGKKALKDKTYEDIVNKGETTYPSIITTPEDTWVILYTSGTTGRPKGVINLTVHILHFSSLMKLNSPLLPKIMD